MILPERESPSSWSPLLQRLRLDWERWRNGRPFPSRQDLDPLELRYILGNLSLIDVLYDPVRFRYRLHATSSVERLSEDLTGKLIEAIPGRPGRAAVLENLCCALESRAPFWICHERMTANRARGRIEVLVLPFSSGGRVVDLLGVGTYFNAAERRHKAPCILSASRS
jgi:hypothetical protein